MDVLKIKNGCLVDISKEGNVIQEVENGKVALNGQELIPTDSNFFKERKKMLYNGVINVNLLISKTGDLLELPRIKLLAVLFEIDQPLLQSFSEYIEEAFQPFVPFKLSKEKEIRGYLIKKIKKYSDNNFHKNPSIILDIIYIDE